MTWRGVLDSPKRAALALFLASLTIGAAVVYQVERVRLASAEASARYQAASRARSFQEAVRQGVVSLHALAAIVHQPAGAGIDLPAVARQILPSHRGLASVSLLPGGVLTDIVPLEGNESVIGWNAIDDPVSGPEIRAAMATRQPFLSPPRPLTQGGFGLVARLAVFLEDPSWTFNPPRFWGLVAVVLRTDALTAAAEIASLDRVGYDWSLSYRDGTVLARSAPGRPAGDAVVEEFELPNGRWRLAVRPREGWLSWGTLLVECGIALVPSLLIAAVVYQNVRVRQARAAAEAANETLRRQEALLSQREAFFRAVFDNAGVGIEVTGRDGTYRTVNEAFARMVGYAREELVGRSSFELTHPDDRARARARAERMFGGESDVTRVEKRYLGRDGREVWAACTATALPGEGGEVGARMTVSVDIGERKRAEEALQATVAALGEAREAAEAANRAKSAFLATMSHEIRTPMNAVLNMTELALDTELTPKQRQYLSVVDASARTLLALINDILDFSKIEAERLELERAPFRLRPLIDEVAESFRAKVLEKHVELIFRVDPAVPDALIGDSLRLRQVLVNLVGNAFKFTERGEVVLSVAREREAAGDGDACLRFEVRDTGIGIPLDKQGLLFRPFTQVDASTSRRYGGTGLGLAICRRLVALMDGALTLASEPGQGSTFTFTARLGVDADDEMPRLAPLGALNGRRVLVVEDNATAREVLTLMLAGFGMSPVAVASGEEALARLTSGAPSIDLVVLDWLLPGVNGLEVARRIRHRPETRALPIVMVSAYSGKEEEVESRTVGINAFLTKPVTASTLHDTIASLYGAGPRVTAQVSVAPEFGGARVLLAEDNETNQLVARELLEPLGLRLDVATTGREAVDMARAHEYAAVLMDVQMPEMDGLEATRRIREERAGRPLPIIAMTANAMKGDIETCRAAGMDDYVSKPIDRRLLLDALRRWISTGLAGGGAGESWSDGAASPAPTLADIDVPGIDVADALTRLGLAPATLITLLRRFEPRAGETLDALGRAIEARDAEAIRRHAHTLAGSAGNVGATRLHRAARDLERSSAAAAPEVERLFHAVSAECEMVRASIRALDHGSADGGPDRARGAGDAPAPVDTGALARALDTLVEQLAASDLTGAAAALDAARAAGCPAPLAADLGRLAAMVEDYDYAGAADLARRMLGALPVERAR